MVVVVCYCPVLVDVCAARVRRFFPISKPFVGENSITANYQLVGICRIVVVVVGDRPDEMVTGARALVI